MENMCSNYVVELLTADRLRIFFKNITAWRIPVEPLAIR